MSQPKLEKIGTKGVVQSDGTITKHVPARNKDRDQQRGVAGVWTRLYLPRGGAGHVAAYNRLAYEESCGAIYFLVRGSRKSRTEKRRETK
jgi:hypothetical protein